MKIRIKIVTAIFTALFMSATISTAAEIRVLATGASKAIVLTLAEKFQTQTGHTIRIEADTAGGVAKRVEGGEAADVVIATRGVVDALIAKGKLAQGSRVDIASTSIGIAIKQGAPKPDISTVEAFKQTLLNAKTITYVDPASGGTSGIYIAGVLEKMGLTEALKPKLRLKAGGYVAELVAKGEAEIAIHQISEILPVKGVEMIGGLPKEIQSVTVYSGGLPVKAGDPGKAFLAFLTGAEAGPVLKAAGMEKP